MNKLSQSHSPLQGLPRAWKEMRFMSWWADMTDAEIEHLLGNYKKRKTLYRKRQVFKKTKSKFVD
jgi:hypothetical protein